MAEQLEPVKRRVALKVIKPGMDSRQVIARFEAERQALAMMDHPNIATVLDAGTTDNGRPYFVMELVNGKPITEYCDQETLTTQRRLELFADVCRAVQHAHQKGVIHRDLKPTNILVAEYDGTPVPKVIDFGVAKATGLQLTEKTLFTEFGQVIGTIEYMSPEQARRNQLDVDTRSDIYSLGIVLYKLLTGETPFSGERFRQAAWDEMIKIIREEEPQLPSIKVGSSASLDQVAVNRNVDPSRLTSQIRGDLDWIVAKSLEKDRNRRYRSAGDFADDIQRHLEQRPVEAAPQSSFDRIRKYIRRNRKKIPWIAAGLMLLSYWIYLGIRGAHQLDQANRRLDQAIQAADLAMERARNSAVGDDSQWDAADAQIQRIEDSLNDGQIKSRDVQSQAAHVIADYRLNKARRDIANQIEDVVLRGASNPSLESWQQMEQNIRSLFLEHDFDLKKEDPADIGKRIRDDKLSAQWTDLLELWIGTRGHMQRIGGPKLTAADMQPWAEAIYIADVDPIRTGIRKFMYTPPPKIENLAFAKDVDLTQLSPRTTSWLASCYAAVRESERANEIYQAGLERHPKDVMLTHDYALNCFIRRTIKGRLACIIAVLSCELMFQDCGTAWHGCSTNLEKRRVRNAPGEMADKLSQ